MEQDKDAIVQAAKDELMMAEANIDEAIRLLRQIKNTPASLLALFGAIDTAIRDLGSL